MKTPQDLMNFMTKYKYTFYDFENDIDWKLEESGDVDTEGNELYHKIGEYKTLEEYELNEVHGCSIKHTIIHFETLGFYIEERLHIENEDVQKKEYFIVEPVQKIVFGNHQKLSVN
ncbi:MAG: hypothetical protein IPI46_12360 [Bacteroidetes bacterium]|nr:hypothetical protein [Bacteroidota bacterium]